jgi:hypothetical protein
MILIFVNRRILIGVKCEGKNTSGKVVKENRDVLWTKNEQQ